MVVMINRCGKSGEDESKVLFPAVENLLIYGRPPAVL